VQNTKERFFIFFDVGETRLHEGLRDENLEPETLKFIHNLMKRPYRIPKLTPISTAYAHTILANPHEVGAFSAMFLDGIAVRSLGVHSTNELHHFRDGRQILVCGVFVLFANEVIYMPECGGPERRELARLQGYGEKRVEPIEQKCVRRI